MDNNNKSTITLCMIVKDEEEHLERCLRSVEGVAEEIVIVDTGSTDRSRQIAKEFGTILLETVWDDDFSTPRNIGLDHATSDWILHLDADEELFSEDKDLLLKTVQNKSYLAYNVENVDPNQVSITTRLWQNKPEIRFKGRFHEKPYLLDDPTFDGKLGSAKIRIWHHGYKLSTQTKNEKISRNKAILIKAIKDDPNDEHNLYYYSVVCANENRTKRAAHILLRLHQRSGGLKYPYCASFLVETLLSNGDLKMALEIGTYALTKFPGFTDVVYLMGKALMQMGEMRKAVEMFELCLRMGKSPVQYRPLARVEHYLPLINLGLLYGLEGRNDKAIDSFKNAISSEPGNELAGKQLLKYLKLTDPENSGSIYEKIMFELQVETKKQN